MTKKIGFSTLGAVTVALLLAACADNNAKEAPQAAAAASAAPKTKTCMTDYSTGSHYNQTVECVTDEEREQEEQQTKEQLDMFRTMQSGTSAH